MPTTIDSLQIEIQSSSTSAAKGIRDLSQALGELKTHGTINVAIKNLNNLKASLNGFNDASRSASAIGILADSLARLKSVGSIGSVGKNITKLSASLKELDKINIDNIAPQILRIVDAVAPLSAVKSGGINTMVNGLLKISKVTASLDDNAIAAFASRIEKLNAVLEPLSAKMTTIQAGLRGINSKARSAGSAVEQMGEDVNAATLNLSSFITTIQGVVQWLQQAVNAAVEITHAATEWDGIASRFSKGFGPQAQETYDWILRLNEEMSINVQHFMQYSSLYAQMLNGFGVASEDASKMALGYTELTYDIWASANDRYKTFADAAEAVASAIAGEVEPIRRAGFTIIESTLEQTAANHGLEISIANATEAEKSYLRYLTLVDQAHSTGVIGTYAQELNTAEGMMRTFRQQLDSLTQAFGSLFLPILVKVMPYLQAFIELLEDGIRKIAGLFGIKIQDIGDTWGGYNSNVDSATANTEGVTSALQDATQAAKELKNATIGIDELNVISPSSSSSTGGVGSSGGAGGGFSDLDIDSLWDETIFDGIQSDVDAIKEKMEGWMPVIASVAAGLAGLRLLKLISDVKEVTKLLNISALADAFKGIKEFFAAAKQMAPEVGWLAALFPKISSAFASIGTAVSGAASSIGTFLAGISAPVWATIAAVIAAIASAAYFLYENWDAVVNVVKKFFDQNIAPKLEEIKEHFSKMGEVLSPLTTAISNFFKGFIEWIQPAIKWIKDFVAEIDLLKGLGKVIEFLGGVVFAVVGGVIAGAFQSAVAFVEGFVQTVSGIVQILGGVVSAVVNLFQGDWAECWEAVLSIGQGVADVFGGLYSMIVKPVKEFVDGVIDFFVYLWDELVGHSIVPDTIDGIVKNFAGLPGRVFKSISGFFENLIQKFKDFWSSLTQWWNKKPSLKAYTPSIGSIVDKVKSAWNSAKSWWNKNVGGLTTKLNIKVPKIEVKWKTAEAFGKSFKYPTGFSLKFAANGGIFDAGSLIWAGERGAEVVANAGGGKTGVMNVAQMQDAVYNGVYAAVSAAMRGQQAGGSGEVKIYLDGKVIAKAVDKANHERGATIMGSEVYGY